MRAFSSGCIRVEKSLELATLLLDDPQRFGPAQLQEAIDSGRTQTLPVRRQVNQGQINFADARQRIAGAEAMVARLPTNSALRAELTRVIADLRKSIPGG